MSPFQPINEKEQPTGAVALTNQVNLPSMQNLIARQPTRLHVVFNCSWAQPLAVSGSPGGSELKGFVRVAPPQLGTPPRSAPNLVTLEIPDLSASFSSSIFVTSLAEYLEPVRLIYELADGTSLVSRARACQDFDDPVPSGAAPLSLLFGPAEYLEALAPLIAGGDTITDKGRRFFSALDEHSEPRLRSVRLRPAEWVRTRNHMSGLYYAIDGRFRERFGKTVHAPYSQLSSVLEDVRYMATLIADLARTHFPAGEGHVQLSDLETACEMWANGELRLFIPSLGVWSNQPSSGYFFYFAELALLAAECGIESPFWRAMARILVRTQEIYCTAYSPGKVPDRPHRQLWDYKACNFDEAKQFDASEKANLRAAYAPFDTHDKLSLRSAKNAKDFVGAFGS